MNDPHHIQWYMLAQCGSKALCPEQRETPGLCGPVMPQEVDRYARYAAALSQSQPSPAPLWLRIQHEVRCPHCQQHQSVIAAKTQPGYCTQCTRWLGTPRDSNKEPPITEELFNWQEWVIGGVEELYLGSRAFGALPWAHLPQGLQVCHEAMGDGRSLARLTNLPYSVLWPWSHGKQTPSFKRLLEFGYVLDVTPLQLLVSTADARRRVDRSERARATSTCPKALACCHQLGTD